MNTPRGRPFPPGNTLGRGRPKGSRNKTKAPGQQLLEDNAELLARKCLVLAMQGDRSAMRLCMERILPARRDTSIRMIALISGCERGLIEPRCNKNATTTT
jgi:hypothetical protein